MAAVAAVYLYRQYKEKNKLPDLEPDPTILSDSDYNNNNSQEGEEGKEEGNNPPRRRAVSPTNSIDEEDLKLHTYITTKMAPSMEQSPPPIHPQQQHQQQSSSSLSLSMPLSSPQATASAPSLTMSLTSAGSTCSSTLAGEQVLLSTNSNDEVSALYAKIHELELDNWNLQKQVAAAADEEEEKNENEQGQGQGQGQDEQTVTTDNGSNQRQQQPKPKKSKKSSKKPSPGGAGSRYNHVLEEENKWLKKQLQQSKEQIVQLQRQQTRLQYEMEEVKVIINLQDELRASRAVMEQQKLQIAQLLNANEQDDDGVSNREGNGDKDNASEDGEDNEDDTWKRQYQELSKKHTQLQMDRAYAEFAFRDRITEDSLKYHRRLIHWKKTTADLQNQLLRLQEGHAVEIVDLRQKLQASAASVLQHTLSELRETKRKLKTFELQQQQHPMSANGGGNLHPQRPTSLRSLTTPKSATGLFSFSSQTPPPSQQQLISPTGSVSSVSSAGSTDSNINININSSNNNLAASATSSSQNTSGSRRILQYYKDKNML